MGKILPSGRKPSRTQGSYHLKDQIETEALMRLWNEVAHSDREVLSADRGARRRTRLSKPPEKLFFWQGGMRLKMAL